MKPGVAVCLTYSFETAAVVTYEDQEAMVAHVDANPTHVYTSGRRGT